MTRRGAWIAGVAAVCVLLAGCATPGVIDPGETGPVEIPSETATASPTPTPSATPTHVANAEAEAQAEAGCNAWIGIWDSDVANPNFAKDPFKTKFANASAQFAKAAAQDDRWTLLANAAAYWVSKNTPEGPSSDDVTKVNRAMLRIWLTCGAGFGIALYAHEPYNEAPYLDSDPDPFPTDPAEIARLACTEWAGVFYEEDELVTSVDQESPFLLPAGWMRRAADADPAWTTAADAMDAWIALNSVDALNALPGNQLSTVRKADSAVSRACSPKEYTWSGH